MLDELSVVTTRTVQIALLWVCGTIASLISGCGGDKPPPGVNDVGGITASVADIVFNCRSVEQGFLASVDEKALRQDVEALEKAAEEFDPDVTFRLPEAAIERKTTLRDQVELAVRLLEEDCSPRDAERFRDAVGD